ncbi:Oidioi.mRNA.OKI2018_I69.chr1.g756.t1.cds [Oikopleura dioica]|uniref:Oidioi.mRNA.OKI2018_I69.chr1.g756.t1.cds n=1 Tax=Oikopleura dioica TaxID=34765 RepID=A0ABN7SR03_OIKDI|nr:Oidioi.mRNA.OKI2018_I69.chr1.g756.t1.cds [Oikopleura dioica]
MNFEEFLEWIHREPEKLTGAAKRKKKMRPADHLHNRLIDLRKEMEKRNVSEEDKMREYRRQFDNYSACSEHFSRVYNSAPVFHQHPDPDGFVPPRTPSPKNKRRRKHKKMQNCKIEATIDITDDQPKIEPAAEKKAEPEKEPKKEENEPKKEIKERGRKRNLRKRDEKPEEPELTETEKILNKVREHFASLNPRREEKLDENIPEFSGLVITPQLEAREDEIPGFEAELEMSHVEIEAMKNEVEDDGYEVPSPSGINSRAFLEEDSESDEDEVEEPAGGKIGPLEDQPENEHILRELKRNQERLSLMANEVKEIEDIKNISLEDKPELP